jgi:hypothetical protein
MRARRSSSALAALAKSPPRNLALFGPFATQRNRPCKENQKETRTNQECKENRRVHDHFSSLSVTFSLGFADSSPFPFTRTRAISGTKRGAGRTH